LFFNVKSHPIPTGIAENYLTTLLYLNVANWIYSLLANGCRTGIKCSIMVAMPFPGGNSVNVNS